MKPRLVIFDCDGVLMDSEVESARVVAADLTARGLPVTPAEAMHRFVGVSLMDMKPRIEAELGRALPEDWFQDMTVKIAAAMELHVAPVEGARAILEDLNARKVAWRIGSNSADLEMDAKFGRTGFLELTRGRTHSAPRLFAAGGRPKPAPDVFLDAAKAEGVTPDECVVIEDSVPGVKGAVAAGMRCVGFDPKGDGAHLVAAGASDIVHRLGDLPELLGL
jgi:beta-phosphoglucomutase-like phosphatase (HAD superfamily)